MDQQTEGTIEKVTFRYASAFGFHLADTISEQMQTNNVSPSMWPKKFPLTLKHLLTLPEIDGNIKIARKALVAAKAMWKDIRQQAINVENDMKLHPELYMDYQETTTSDIMGHQKEWAWRHLSVEIEQLAGNIFVTEFGNEELAEDNVYSLVSARQLKNYMVDFDDDYNNFISEVREIIRDKKEIKAAVRFELICLLNSNTKRAIKLKNKKPLKKTA